MRNHGDAGAMFDGPMLTHDGSLTVDELRAFERDGYVVRPGFFSAAEMNKIDHWTRELEEAPEVPGRHWIYRETSLKDTDRKVLQRIENFCPFHTSFDRLFREGRVIRCLGQLFREPAVLFKDKVNFKMPGGSGFKPHQDQQAGWSAYASFFITVLISIDDATKENGCLEIVAGQHRRGLIGDEWKPLDDEVMAEMNPVPLTARRGDAVFFDSYVPHGSKPNLTERPRRALYVTYNRASEGDQRARYFAEKHKSFPPDIDRDPKKTYVFKV
jgi:2-aminoethylphosphonate dioxygenase